MSNNPNDYLNDKSGSSPIKVILIIAVVLAVAGIGYLLASRAGVLLSPDGTRAPPMVEGMIEDANPFPETEAFNLPPVEEMVDEAPAVNGSSNREATDGAPQASATPSINIEQAMSPRGIGDPNAPVRLVEFFSLTCNHCANFHNITLPQIKSYIDKGEVYLEFYEFPLNAPAMRASMVARCLPEDRYYGYITLLFKTQDTWMRHPDYTTILRQNAKLAGMNDETFDACIANTELRQAIVTGIQQATERWNIESTPAFVVNEGTFTINGKPAVIRGAQPAYEFERLFRLASDGKVAPLLKDRQPTQPE